jgi:ATP-binding cassette, subfamily B, bacterial PglK
MVFPFVLKSLWKMLERQRRIYFSILVVALFVSGIFEMAGMMIIFGFIRGLSVNPITGNRPGLGKVLGLALDRPLTDLEFAIFGGSIVIAAIGLKNAQAMVVRFQISRFLSNLEHRISQQLFAALATIPYERVIKMGGAGLQERLRSTQEVLSACFRAATQILADGAMVAMILGLLVLVDPYLTVLGLVIFGGVGVGIYRRLQRRLRTMGRLEHNARRRIGRTLDDAFGGLVEMRLRDKRAFFQDRHQEALGERLRIDRRVDVLARVPAAINETVLTLAITTSVLYMVVADKDLAHFLPVLGIFGFAGMRANGALSRMNRSFQALRQKGERFEQRLRELERVAPQVLGTSDIEVPTYLVDEKPLPEGRDGRLHHQLELRSVSFRYPRAADLALKDISVIVPRGSFVSFCGESGSGKSTLVMVLMGLMRPGRGAVLCDGWSVFDHIRSWQGSIGYVGQSSYLSYGNVRDNVAFGVPPAEVDDDRVWTALELAAARGFVEGLPQRLDTMLASGASRLSGGQRQRIIIARALYHDPDVVVFDEATAALDNVTEQEITDAALRLRQQKTVICVAHRLSTIVRSDVIHVVQDGRIVDSGGYSELLERSDAFRRLALASHR